MILSVPSHGSPGAGPEQGAAGVNVALATTGLTVNRGRAPIANAK
ncbi:hypothetical protein [Novosphingobium sp. CECT 9465]|nr:hypothetical protein [Novosphingobium sp. CECT 9465]